MKNIKTALTIAFALLVAVAPLSANKYDDPEIITKKIKLTEFTKISVSSGWDLYLTQGDNHSMIVKADAKSMESLETEIKEGVLIIKSKSKFSIIKNSKRVIHLTFIELEALNTSGGCDINFETKLRTENFQISMSGGSDLNNLDLEAKNLSLSTSGGSDAKINVGKIEYAKVAASGGSDVTLTKLDAQKFKMIISGGSDATLSGTSKASKITGSGGCDISATNFTTENCIINLSSAADAKMSVTGQLEVSLSGGSDFHCKGNPTITKRSIDRSSDFKMD